LGHFLTRRPTGGVSLRQKYVTPPAELTPRFVFNINELNVQKGLGMRLASIPPGAPFFAPLEFVPKNF
jgi:hypothetical protein